ncbi:hypothetical protein FRAHR75_390013 [Frankia sp. Hr75.2]|nr:hypothetical protein FRAHR75_390013 [Frankia sp. Hr75.2]
MLYSKFRIARRLGGNAPLCAGPGATKAGPVIPPATAGVLRAAGAGAAPAVGRPGGGTGQPHGTRTDPRNPPGSRARRARRTRRAGGDIARITRALAGTAALNAAGRPARSRREFLSAPDRHSRVPGPRSNQEDACERWRRAGLFRQHRAGMGGGISPRLPGSERRISAFSTIGERAVTGAGNALQPCSPTILSR